MTLERIFFSIDFILALIVSCIIFIVLPYQVPNTIAQDIYFVGISVLSIVFSLYFAALAVIVSSGDNRFITFLELEGRYYTRLLATFKYSLIVILVSLIFSILMYCLTSFILSQEELSQSIWYLTFFSFLFSYSLLVALMSILDSINYAKYRAIYLNSNHD